MSYLGHLSRSLGNKLYRVAFPVYRPLYSAFKAASDREERALLANVLREGDVVADVGANIGIYSEFFARRVGAQGAVHSFEPSPENFQRLQSVLCGFSNVRLNQLAVGNETGETFLYVSDNLNVDHRAYPTAGVSRRRIAIRSIKLDDYFKPGQPVDFVKMDIQGFELHALLGAGRILSDNPRIKLLLEFWPYGLGQAGDSAADLLDFLRAHRFATYRVSRGVVERSEPQIGDAADPDNYSNLFVKRAEDGA